MMMMIMTMMMMMMMMDGLLLVHCCFCSALGAINCGARRRERSEEKEMKDQCRETFQPNSQVITHAP